MFEWWDERGQKQDRLTGRVRGHQGLQRCYLSMGSPKKKRLSPSVSRSQDGTDESKICLLFRLLWQVRLFIWCLESFQVLRHITVWDWIHSEDLKCLIMLLLKCENAKRRSTFGSKCHDMSQPVEMPHCEPLQLIRLHAGWINEQLRAYKLRKSILKHV